MNKILENQKSKTSDCRKWFDGVKKTKLREDKHSQRASVPLVSSSIMHSLKNTIGFVYSWRKRPSYRSRSLLVFLSCFSSFLHRNDDEYALDPPPDLGEESLFFGLLPVQ